MKTHLAIAILFALTATASAQKGGTFSPNNTLLEINGETVTVKSFATAQTIANGGVVHDITTELALGTSLPVLPYLLERLSKAEPSRTFAMKVLFTTNGDITQSRDYGNVTITSIEFPGLNGTSKDAVVLTLKLTALSLTTKEGGGKAAGKLGAKFKQVSQGSFEVKLDNLPTRFLDRVSAFKILPCAQFKCDSITPFEVWIRGVDAAPWMEWFAQSAANPQLTKSGSITLLSTNLKDPIITLTLTDARPTAYEDVTTPQGSKAHVHLSVKRVRAKVYN